ncbi:hypothetical protein DUNSADRAFT_9471, partial [Dunaliella salina]
RPPPSRQDDKAKQHARPEVAAALAALSLRGRWGSQANRAGKPDDSTTSPGEAQQEWCRHNDSSQTSMGSESRRSCGGFASAADAADALRMPPDRQTKRTVTAQCQEWTQGGQMPQLRVRGRHLVCKHDEQEEEPWQQQAPLLAESEVPNVQQPLDAAVTRAEERTLPVQPQQQISFGEHKHGSRELLQGGEKVELCVTGMQITTLRPPDAALHTPACLSAAAAREQEEGEVLAAHGILEEVLAVQYDTWEAHVTSACSPLSGQGGVPGQLQQQGHGVGAGGGQGADKGQFASGAYGREGCPQRSALDAKDPVQSILEQAVDEALARTWGLLIPALAPLVVRRLRAREAARQRSCTLACGNDNGPSPPSEHSPRLPVNPPIDS